MAAGWSRSTPARRSSTWRRSMRSSTRRNSAPTGSAASARTSPRNRRDERHSSRGRRPRQGVGPSCTAAEATGRPDFVSFPPVLPPRIGPAARSVAAALAASAVTAAAGSLAAPAPAGVPPPCDDPDPALTTTTAETPGLCETTTDTTTTTDTATTVETLPQEPTTAPAETTTPPPVATTAARAPRPSVPKATAQRPTPAAATTPKPASGTVADASETAAPLDNGTPTLLGAPYVFPVFAQASSGETWGAARADVAWHHGIDIFARLGSPVVAVADGVLFSVGWNTIRGLGALLPCR